MIEIAKTKTLLGLILTFSAVIVEGQSQDYDSLYLVRNCVILDVKESIQVEREDLIYNWKFGDGSESHGQVVEHCYDNLGDYEVMLSIVDPSISLEFQDEWLFEVSIEEDYQLFFATNTQASGEVNLVSSLRYENQPLESRFFWDFGDGNYGVGSETTHKYDSAGDYSVRLLAQLFDGEEVIVLAKTATIQINKL